MASQLNWLGLAPHPTDEYLDFHDSREDMEKLRAAYYRVFADVLPMDQREEALKVLLDAAVKAGRR